MTNRKPVPTTIPNGDPQVNKWLLEWAKERAELEEMEAVVRETFLTVAEAAKTLVYNESPEHWNELRGQLKEQTDLVATLRDQIEGTVKEWNLDCAERDSLKLELAAKNSEIDSLNNKIKELSQLLYGTSSFNAGIIAEAAMWQKKTMG